MKEAVVVGEEASSESESIRKLKTLYNYTCQLCNHPLNRGYGEPVVYGHYLQPLEEGGPDSTENLLLLCPNHRALFEAGSLALDLEHNRVVHLDPRDRQNGRALVVKHQVSPTHADYHNRKVFKGF